MLWKIVGVGGEVLRKKMGCERVSRWRWRTLAASYVF